MPDIWRIYHVRECPHTIPVKDKLVLIVCIDITPLGFFINTNIRPYILNRPELLSCQISIKANDYWFLDHDSLIDCTKIYPFDDDDLVDGRGLIVEETREEIKRVVSTAKTIENRFKKLIIANP